MYSRLRIMGSRAKHRRMPDTQPTTALCGPPLGDSLSTSEPIVHRRTMGGWRLGVFKTHPRPSNSVNSNRPPDSHEKSVSREPNRGDAVAGIHSFERVISHQHQIGGLSRLNASYLRFHLEFSCIADRRSPEDLRQRHPRFLQLLHLQVAVQTRQVSVGRA
jgi:hypothetical protein